MDRRLATGIGLQDHAKTGRAADIPGATPASYQFVSISPVVIDVPDRLMPLQLRVTVPTDGSNLPIILLSHGDGTLNNLGSLNGYAPLAQYYAAHGFAVIQPTHLTSNSLQRPAGSPRPSQLWHTRATDMTHILDHLDHLEVVVPLIRGRLDHHRVAVVGHSIGGHTAAVLLGLRVKEGDNASLRDLQDTRVKTGVIIGAPGGGGEALTTFAQEKLLFLRAPDFSEMHRPALVVGGDADDMSSLTVKGPLWWADHYHMSPGPKHLLTFNGGKHNLGGISGWDTGSAEENNENPETVAAVQRMTLAYLRSRLYVEDNAWEESCAALKTIANLGQVEGKNL